MRMIGSQRWTDSTRMTSAPRSLTRAEANGPAHTTVRSITRTPCKGRGDIRQRLANEAEQYRPKSGRRTPAGFRKYAHPASARVPASTVYRQFGTEVRDTSVGLCTGDQSRRRTRAHLIEDRERLHPSY